MPFAPVRIRRPAVLLGVLRTVGFVVLFTGGCVPERGESAGDSVGDGAPDTADTSETGDSAEDGGCVAVLGLTPAQLDFGVVPVGASAMLIVALGAVNCDLAVSAVSLGFDAATDFAFELPEGLETPFVLPGGFSAAIVVTFTPTTTSPVAAALLIVTDSADSPVTTLPLVGDDPV